MTCEKHLLGKFIWHSFLVARHRRVHQSYHCGSADPHAAQANARNVEAWFGLTGEDHPSPCSWNISMHVSLAPCAEVVPTHLHSDFYFFFLSKCSEDKSVLEYSEWFPPEAEAQRNTLACSYQFKSNLSHETIFLSNRFFVSQSIFHNTPIHFFALKPCRYAFYNPLLSDKSCITKKLNSNQFV